MTMDNHLLSNVNISQMREAFKNSEQIGIDDEFCLINMRFRNKERMLNYPLRFDGVLLVWCIKGSLSVSVNLNDYILEEKNLFICVPGNIFKLNEIVGSSEDLQYVCMAISKEFAGNQKINVNKTFTNALSLLDNPCVKIGEQEAVLMSNYIKMMGEIVKADLTYKKESVQTLWMSVLYLLAGILDKRRKTMTDSSSSNRSRLLFEQFISLVSRYHDQYRNVGFYADKLCLTPKYLSKLIKNATGRSAPDWIDSYVILEAKNMLKYSNCTIKEIVYKLNFPNQSVFYKFFKARTGMTPSEYRNS